MPIELICLDADDTLWHNMRHFDATEAIFADLLAPFAEAGVSREQLSAVEIRNLRLYGYGAKSFTLSMVETALELAGDRLTHRTIADILAAGRELLAHPVELLPGVEEALDVLGGHARLVLVTKASCCIRRRSSPPRASASASQAWRSSATRRPTPSIASSPATASRRNGR